jgi:hypothetical protein
MKADKFCPLFSMGVLANSYVIPNMNNPDLLKKATHCRWDFCQLWTSAYTTEGIEIFDCAFVIGARKNAEGKIPV